jgi:hypothetical protein
MIKNRTVYLLFLFVLALAGFGSCDSKEDTEYPKIIINQPLAGNSYENGDTIAFNALISDNIQLSNVEVLLVDQDNKPVLANISIVPTANPFTFHGEYIINDPMLAGGTYQLRFKASDGVNSANQFVEIQVYELERQLLYPLIVTHPNSGNWLVYSLTNNNAWKETYSHTGDYIGSEVNSSASLLYICGIYQSDLSAIQLPDGVLRWNVKPEIYESWRWFESLNFSYPNLYVCCANGSIRGYNNTGAEIYRSETYANSVPNLSVTSQNFVIGSFKDAFSNDSFLVAFHSQGGKMIYNKFVQDEVVDLIHVENDKVLVFSNSSGHGVILLYDGADNSMGVIHPFNDGTFREVSTMDKGNYLVSCSTGLYWYRLNDNSLIPFVPAEINSLLACDNTSQLIFTCSGKTMNVYNFPDATLAESIPLPDTVIDLHLVFNK